MSALGLTGNTRYRIGFFGRLILEVEYLMYVKREYGGDSGFYLQEKVTKWRDANFYDLQQLDLVNQHYRYNQQAS